MPLRLPRISLSPRPTEVGRTESGASPPFLHPRLDSFDEPRGATRSPGSGVLDGVDVASFSASAAAPVESSLPALLDALVKPGGTGTAADVAVVKKKLATLPIETLRALRAAGVSVVACRDSITDHLTHLKGVRPRGWPPGKTWDSVPGIFEPTRREVVIGTRGTFWGSRRVPTYGQGHGSTDLLPHELAHALDYAAGVGGTRVSQSSSAFQTAYAADRPALEHKDPYLAQPPPAGPEEAFAESFARMQSNPTALAKDYPALAAFWREQAANGYPLFEQGAVA